LRKSCVLNVTDVWNIAGRLRSNHETIFLENKICTMLPASKLNRPPKFWGPHCNLGEAFFMRSKLAIAVLVVTSLFGSTLIASAQSQPAPGASGTISPGATGKKTQKGTTTGSTTRSGANKGGAADPSAQDNAGSGADTMAAPKSGSRY
jgi:hypothetical protein